MVTIFDAILDDSFKNRVKTSFHVAREDMKQLKTGMDSWLRYLERENHILRQQLLAMEVRVRQLEQEQMTAIKIQKE